MDYTCLESGDIGIHSSSDFLGKIIKFLSFEKFSHVNIFIWMKNIDGELKVVENNKDNEAKLYILDTNYGLIKKKYDLFEYRENLNNINCFVIRKISKSVKRKVDMCKFLENYIEKVKDKIFYDYDIINIFKKITNIAQNRIDEKVKFMCVDFVEKYLRDLFFEIEGYKPNESKDQKVTKFTKNEEQVFNYFFGDSEPIYLKQKKTMDYGILLFSLFYFVLLVFLMRMMKE